MIAPQFSEGVSRVIAAAELVEATDLNALYLIDHLVPDHAPETPCWELASVAGALAVRSGLRLGTLVLRVPMRGVETSVKIAATMGSIAQGRTVIGLGAGDFRIDREGRRMGMSVPPFVERVVQTCEASDRIKRLGIPTLIGGNHPRMLEAAAEYACGWNSWGTSVERFESLATRAKSLNSDTRPSWASVVLLGRDGDHLSDLVGHRGGVSGVTAGDPMRIADVLGRFLDAGASEIMVSLTPDNSETWDLFCHKTLPILC